MKIQVCSYCLSGIVATAFSLTVHGFAFVNPRGESLPSNAGVQQEQTANDSSRLGFDRGKVFDEVVSFASEHFFDRSMNGLDWQSLAREFRMKAIAARDREQYSAIINELLSKLDVSHTKYFSKHEPKHYQLLGVFQQMFPDQPESFFSYDGIGIDTEQTARGHAISAVYDGLPADQCGLKYGDLILTVNGQPFHPILSFAEREGKQVDIGINRNGRSINVTATVEKLDGRTMFETALVASVRVIEKHGKQVGYIHAWSYAGLKFHELIQREVLDGRLSECDALVLDLRDGWGGASPDYLNLFRDPIVQLEMSDREKQVTDFARQWRKPVALVVNEGTTSGKEVFAYGFKKMKFGRIFGERTAGAVVAGRCKLLSNGDALYLAVRDVRVDGKRLEGVGVAPDRQIKRSIDDMTSDPQLEAAVDFLVADGEG